MAGPPTPTRSTTTKYQNVRAQLETAIRDGEFAPGDQLPNEQALALRYGVSYLTARRAVSDLVEADLLERRARRGTYVRSPGSAEPMPAQTTTLSLITTTYDQALAREFISTGSRLAEREGWQPNVIRLYAGQQDAAVRAVRNGDLALALLDEIPRHSSLAHAMRAAQGKAICLGTPTTNIGVPCILIEPNQIFRLGVDYLLAQGHRDLLFVTQDLLEPTNRVQQESWALATADRYSGSEAAARMLHVRTPMFQCPTHDTYEALSRYFSEPHEKVTAILSFGEEVTQGVLAACRDAGKPIPAQISVLNILDGPSVRYAHPPVTSVDVDFEEQLRVAGELLKASLQGQPPALQPHYVTARLIVRQSVNRRNAR